jgi:hypothetical protein
MLMFGIAMFTMARTPVGIRVEIAISWPLRGG